MQVKTGEVDIINCYNIGKIVSTGINSTDSYAGGIIGGEYASKINITNCYNLGEIKAKKTAAGIAPGGTAGTITITNCYNAGFIDAIKSLTLGYGTIEKSYYLDGVGNDYGGKAITQGQLQNKEKFENDQYIIELLNSYVDEYNKNNDFELLNWKKDENGYTIF